MWKLISTSIEEAFVKYLNLTDKDAKNIRGRGTPHFLKHVEDPGIVQEAPVEKGAAALHRLANRHGTQASRLGHIAATSRSLNATPTSESEPVSEASRQKKVQQIDRTFRNFAGGTDLDNNQEVAWKDRIDEIGKCSWQSYPVSKRAETWHQGQQDKYRSQAFAANRKQKTEEMTCPKKCTKNISKALNKQAASPLLYAKRDRTGPKGEAIGTIATNPREVDQIGTRAWTTIYDGNFDELAVKASVFMGKYKNQIYTRKKAFRVEPITAAEVASSCKEAKASVAGLDNWEPAELALLCDSGYEWIAALLNRIEDGYGWPDGAEHARAAYLAKNLNQSDNPLEYRVLMILPSLYRRWASTWLEAVKGWTDDWGMNDSYAGTGNQGAEDASYALAG